MLVELDGKPVADLSLGKLRELFKRPGSTYTLKVERGGHPLIINLKLRRLV
jgi:S1-C subfamily serine protease